MLSDSCEYDDGGLSCEGCLLSRKYHEAWCASPRVLAPRCDAVEVQGLMEVKPLCVIQGPFCEWEASVGDHALAIGGPS